MTTIGLRPRLGTTSDTGAVALEMDPGTRIFITLPVFPVGIVTLTGCRGTKPPYRVLRRSFTTDILGLSQLVMR